MGSLIDDTIEGLLSGPVRHKKGLKRVRGIVQRSPEVMVKISGNARDSGHVNSHLSYISRNGKLELEDERGDIWTGKEAVKNLAEEWSQDKGKRRKNTRETTNIILSMPKGTNPLSVKDAVRSFAKSQFGGNYQYVMALHTDTDSPHVHLTVKSLGFDGKRLHVKKGDPQKWRESFANELNLLGVKAEATPRAVRGVIKKSVKQTIKHIRSKGKVPRIDQEKIQEIFESIRSGQDGSYPWEVKISERQTRVRKAWLSVAKDLSERGVDKGLAQEIVKFVNDMPEMKTERHEIKELIANQLQQQDQDER